MAVQGHLLTDEKYKQYLDDLFARLDEPSVPFDFATNGDWQ
jgi:hypothetical protein